MCSNIFLLASLDSLKLFKFCVSCSRLTNFPLSASDSKWTRLNTALPEPSEIWMITGRCEVSSSAIVFTLSPVFIEKNKINLLYFKHKGLSYSEPLTFKIIRLTKCREMELHFRDYFLICSEGSNERLLVFIQGLLDNLTRKWTTQA